LLPAVDEANLVLDHPGQINVFLAAGLLREGGFIGAGGVPDVESLRQTVGRRIATLPQLCRIPVAVGRRHRWMPSAPDLTRHIRVVPSVKGPPGFERLCADLMTVPLPWDRPMWELLIVPGACAGGLGVVLRIHHSIADGVAAVAIVREIFDRSEGAPVEDGHGAAAPPHRRREGPRGTLRRIGFGLERIRITLTGHEIGSTILLGDRGPHRGVRFLETDLVALEARARASDGTVNDALLAAVGSGYRGLLASAGEAIPDRLPVSVPVALRRRGTTANRVGVMLVQLPLGESDPDARLDLIADQTRSAKVVAREQGTLELMRGPLGARIMDRLAHGQHVVAGFVTNVPGPREALELAGAPLAAIWPVAVLAANVRLGVAAASYDGRLYCSIHFDDEHVAGADFARAMAQELSRLTGTDHRRE
jgi:WS/DGAT/MGAT family acyltransferase